YRCELCYAASPQCRQCVVDSHVHVPFHWISEWNGRHFVRHELADLGLIMGLEHQSHLCTQKPAGQTATEFMVIDVTGVHRCMLMWCYCGCRPQIEQLMLAGLFPATVEDPSHISTAFTFHVLRDFHVHSLSSKKSAYDYYDSLSRLT
ncbi:hypothetical protein K439DRAFT_1287374, partial [Ramaria rubella]